MADISQVNRNLSKCIGHWEAATKLMQQLHDELPEGRAKQVIKQIQTEREKILTCLEEAVELLRENAA